MVDSPLRHPKVKSLLPGRIAQSLSATLLLRCSMAPVELHLPRFRTANFS